MHAVLLIFWLFFFVSLQSDGYQRVVVAEFSRSENNERQTGLFQLGWLLGIQSNSGKEVLMVAEHTRGRLGSNPQDSQHQARTGAMETVWLLSVAHRDKNILSDFRQVAEQEISHAWTSGQTADLAAEECQRR